MKKKSDVAEGKAGVNLIADFHREIPRTNRLLIPGGLRDKIYAFVSADFWPARANHETIFTC